MPATQMRRVKSPTSLRRVFDFICPYLQVWIFFHHHEGKNRAKLVMCAKRRTYWFLDLRDAGTPD
jgi:hypothetical protein